jgi:hypothetical protein
MGLPVSAGDSLTYTAQVTNTLTLTPDGVIAQVKSILADEPGATPFVFVNSYQNTTPSLSSQIGILATTSFTLPFSVTMQVTTDGDWGDSSDLQAVIDNAFYQVTGKLPSASSITAINGEPTGQAAAANQNPGGGGSASQSIGQIVSDFFSGLGTGGTLLTAGIVIIVVIILLVVLAPERVAHAAAALG